MMRPNLSHHARREEGSAMLLVLFVLFMLTAAVVAWAKWVQATLDMAGDRNRELEARAMAHSGLAIAMHPLVSEKTPILEEQLGPDYGYRVRIVGEGGKLNINWLLAGEEPRKLDILRRWLELHGLEYNERDIFIDSLLDYIDADNVKRLNGAEAEGDYFPANRPLLTVDELEEVANAGLLLARSPGWREELTIYSSGPIDLSAANERILSLLPGLGDARMQRFLQIRRGRDGIDGTIDDYQFRNLEEIRQYLGLSQAQFREMGGLISAKDNTQHLTAEGQSGNVIRQVEAVVRKGGANPAVIYWKE